MMAGTELEVHPQGQATSRKPIPHGTNSGYKYHRCRCIPCADAAAAYQLRRRRRQGAGVWQPLVDTARAVAHIEDLRRQGMAVAQIVTASGVQRASLDRIRGVSAQPTIRRIKPETEARILAVRFQIDKVTERAHVPSRGAVRRLQALRAQGWPVHVLADRCGLDKRTLVALPRQGIVYAQTHLRICEVYDDLRDLDPARHGVLAWVAKRTRRESRVAGFPPPCAWADIDTDRLPAPRGEWAVRFAKANPGTRTAAVIEDTAELAEQGETRDRIAARIGISWDAITAAHRRAGVPLPTVAETLPQDEDAA